MFIVSTMYQTIQTATTSTPLVSKKVFKLLFLIDGPPKFFTLKLIDTILVCCFNEN